jgi:hypothetical protein
MIKLLDILKEDNNVALNNDTHWRDHFKEIIACAETALSSNDPETIATQVSDIIDHAEAAGSKHEATWTKQPPPTAINSSTYNSYSGDDSDIHAYQNPI